MHIFFRYVTEVAFALTMSIFYPANQKTHCLPKAHPNKQSLDGTAAGATRGTGSDRQDLTVQKISGQPLSSMPLKTCGVGPRK